MTGYDPHSCNALQRPFYRPVEAALRWCNLTDHEGMILQLLGDNHTPKIGQFPQWPCLQANTEKILDAIAHGNIPVGRDGKPVPANEHVAAPRRTVRHTDLRAWFLKHEPGQKPPFLFDEIERSAHAAINVDSFRALQADRDALKARLEKATEVYRSLKQDRDEIEAQRASLAATMDGQTTPGRRAETTYLCIVGSLLELVLNPRTGRDSDAAVILELVNNYGDKPGIATATLQAKFAEAKRRLQAS
jgi:hypothetical protein